MCRRAFVRTMTCVHDYMGFGPAPNFVSGYKWRDHFPMYAETFQKHLPGRVPPLF